MVKLVRVHIGAIIALFVTFTQALALLSYSLDEGGYGYVSITGTIESDEFDKFRKMIETFPNTKYVVLSSEGGLVDPALKIGRLTRQIGLPTVAKGMCASACALIWLAGKPLFSFDDASIGFHSPHSEDKVSSVGNAFVGAYLSQLGYSDNVIIMATFKAPSDMQWLSFELAAALGLEVKAIDSLASVAGPISRTQVGGTTTTIPQGDGQSNEVQGLNDGWFVRSFANLDLWGGDIVENGVPAEDESNCASKCSMNMQCRFYTYNVRQRRCFLKSDYYLSLNWEGANSGVMYLAASANEAASATSHVVTNLTCRQNSEIIGSWEPWHQSTANNLGSCLLTCFNTNTCQYVTYGGRIGGSCLFRRLDGQVLAYAPRKGAVSCQKQDREVLPTGDPVFLGQRDAN